MTAETRRNAEDGIEMDALKDRQATAVAQTQAEELALRVRAALARLPHQQAQELALGFLEDVSYRQLAEEWKRQLAAARRIQLGLFPRSLDLDPRLDIAGANRPGFGISGDYYDCQVMGPDRLAFIVADVMGHGLASAMVMTQLQAVFRTAVREGWELEQLDRRLDEVMLSTWEGEVFATGLLGVVDLAGDVLCLLCAGHPWPSVLREGRHVQRLAAAYGSPWGAPRAAKPARPGVLAVSREWSLLAYTDGLVEAEDSLGRRYSADRLARVHSENRGRSAEQLCETVLDDALSHASDSLRPQDDLTVLAICRRE
jgi:sigma-B regulation protein RsbU (phosphoserine phosphatase)